MRRITINLWVLKDKKWKKSQREELFLLICRFYLLFIFLSKKELSLINFVDPTHFKLWILLDQIVEVGNIKDLHNLVAKIQGWWYDLSLWQRLNFFAESTKNFNQLKLGGSWNILMKWWEKNLGKHLQCTINSTLQHYSTIQILVRYRRNRVPVLLWTVQC